MQAKIFFVVYISIQINFCQDCVDTWISMDCTKDLRLELNRSKKDTCGYLYIKDTLKNGDIVYLKGILRENEHLTSSPMYIKDSVNYFIVKDYILSKDSSSCFVRFLSDNL